ncbi:MAG: acetylglutamate kinase [Firmicutes bacterium]|nr:acetylglutamate kinase [Bacillota bacterium]
MINLKQVKIMDTKDVEILIEALPYIKKFRNKTFVIKYGGSIFKNELAKKAFIDDVALLSLSGINIIIVHGGGPNISEMLTKLDKKTRFINGLRVTDKETMDIVEMVLSGKINKEITTELCNHGINALGVSGRDSKLITAKKKLLDSKEDLGYVGEVVSINNKFLLDLVNKNYIPVISPIGADDKGNAYNINADYVASFISSKLKTEKLIYISDVKGIYKDINDDSSFINRVNKKEIKELINKGLINGGMIPKMECSLMALDNGTKDVHLIDGRKEHSLLIEIFTNDGIGTMIEGGF